MNDDEEKLLNALKSLPFDGHEDVTNEHENVILIIVLSAGTYEPVDETIAFIEEHQNEGFEAVTQAILQKWFSEPLEIVDDDEYED